MRRWVCTLAMLIPSCGGAQAERSESPPARSGMPPSPAASAPPTEAPAATSDTTRPDALPPAATQSPDEPPGLAPNHIADVVNDSYAIFNDCFRRVAKSAPKLAGTVIVVWRITPSGEVADAKVARGSLVDERVHRCIVRVLGQLRFDPAERPTEASWSFAFGRAN